MLILENKVLDEVEAMCVYQNVHTAVSDSNRIHFLAAQVFYKYLFVNVETELDLHQFMKFLINASHGIFTPMMHP